MQVGRALGRAWPGMPGGQAQRTRRAALARSATARRSPAAPPNLPCRAMAKAAYAKSQELRRELDATWAAFKEQNLAFKAQQEVRCGRQEWAGGCRAGLRTCPDTQLTPN